VDLEALYQQLDEQLGAPRVPSQAAAAAAGQQAEPLLAPGGGGGEPPGLTGWLGSAAAYHEFEARQAAGCPSAAAPWPMSQQGENNLGRHRAGSGGSPDPPRASFIEARVEHSEGIPTLLRCI
jgi:hypothetical protein